MVRRCFLRTALAGASAIVAACSPLGVLNTLVPSSTYRRSANIPYGTHERQRLDVYTPATSMGPAPLVVFFYGGNWASGARGDYAFAGEALASQGMVAVIADYRLHPEVRYPDFLDDCARAVRWSLEQAAPFGAGANGVFLMGHSAGAYNAGMLAMNASYLQRAGVAANSIRGFIGLAGPYDFLPLTGSIAQRVFGYPDTPRTTQPIEFVSTRAPRSLLITGDEDNVVDPGNSARLAARLRAVNVPVQHIVYPGVGHKALVGALAAPLRGLNPVLADVARFVRGS